MNKNKNIVKFVNIYLIGYFLFMLYKLCEKVPYLSNRYIKYFSYLCFFVTWLLELKKYDMKEIISSIVLILIGIVTYIVSSSDTLFAIFLMIIPLKYISNNKMIKVDFYTKIIITFILFILYINGKITYDIIYKRMDSDKIREAFGYKHPNIFAFVLASIAVDFILINMAKIEKISIKFIISIIIIMLIIFIEKYTDSRSSALFLLSVFIICLFYKRFKFKLINIKPIKFLIVNSFTICIILSLILGMIYKNGNSFAEDIDKLFNTRIYFISEYLNEYKISLFGNKMEFISSEESKAMNTSLKVLDNTYINYLLQYGIISLTILAFLFRRFFKNAYRKKEYFYVLLMLLFNIYLFSECKLHISILILLVGKELYNYKDREKIDE